MTARYSYDIDDQSIGTYLKDLVDQVNDEQSTNIKSSKHYDHGSYVPILKQLIEVVNANYDGEDIPVGNFDSKRIAEIIRRVGAKVNPISDGDVPEWVPDGALLYARPADGHYWLNGAEVTLDQLFNNTEGMTIDADGLAAKAQGDPSNDLTFTAGLLAMLTNDAGLTIVAQYKRLGNVIPAFSVTSSNNFFISSTTAFDNNGPDSINFPAGNSTGVVRTAVAADASTYSGSVNGDAATTGTMGSPASFSSSASISTAKIHMEQGGTGCWLQEFTILPHKSSGELPALATVI